MSFDSRSNILELNYPKKTISGWKESTGFQAVVQELDTPQDGVWPRMCEKLRPREKSRFR
jgi:hypothetical protein